jgi:hypothetical protein
MSENPYRVMFYELCYLSNERNKINHLRSKARWRKAYWTKVLKIVEAHKGSNSLLRKLDPQKSQARINSIKSEMNYLKNKYKNPKNWINMGSMKIRANILKAEADYAQAKYDTLVFTEKYSLRNKELLTALGVKLAYSNGYVDRITTWRGQKVYEAIGIEKIKEMAHKYELDKALEEVILDEKVLSTET